jgi:hypothetical protein
MRDIDKEGLHRVYAPITTTSKETTKKYFLRYATDPGQDAYMFNSLSRRNYAIYKLTASLIKLKRLKTRPSLRLGTLTTTVNLNFLRKERLYTKLKYSRSPAYDIVSGGSAALLAGFLGFLISEKFGFELVDSGDFYYAFMYVVFLAFSIKPLSLVASNRKGFLDAFSV